MNLPPLCRVGWWLSVLGAYKCAASRERERIPTLFYTFRRSLLLLRLPPLLAQHSPRRHPHLPPKKLHHLVGHFLRATNITNRPLPPLPSLTLPSPPIQRPNQIPLPQPSSPSPIRQLPMLNPLPTLIPRIPRQEKRQSNILRLIHRPHQIHQSRQKQNTLRIGL